MDFNLDDEEELEETGGGEVDDYDPFAHYYDQQYQKITADLDFYEQMARRAGANVRVLELACGSGRITLPLLKAGFRVTGLDASTKMLEIARQKVEAGDAALKERARFVEGDMRDFEFPGEQYDLIFIALNSFQHLLTQDDQLACLHVCRQHLAPAGIFIVDIYNPEEKDHYPADGRVEFDNQFRNPENGNLVQVFLSTTAQPAEQVRHYTFFFDEIGPGGAVKRTVANLNLRYTYRYELQLLLDKAGFSVEDFYGSHEFDEYGPGSGKLIYVCRRKA